MNFDEKIGQKLRHYRMLKGMTQQELADAIAISFQQVQKYEKGKNKISLERLCLLGRVLDVPLEAWLDEAYPSPSAPLQAEMGDRQVLSLVQAFRSIPTAHHRTLLCELSWALAEK